MTATILLISIAALAGPVDNVQLDKDRNVTHVPLKWIQDTYLPAKASQPLEVDAKYMKAFLVAYDAFEKTPSVRESAKDMKNYLAVYFSEDKANYYVVFLSKEKFPPHEGMMDGETFYGQNTRYTIDKTSYQIKDRVFYLLKCTPVSVPLERVNSGG